MPHRLNKVATGLTYFRNLAKDCFALLRKHATLIKRGCALAFLLLLVLVTAYVAMRKLGLLGHETGGNASLRRTPAGTGWEGAGGTQNRGGPAGNQGGMARGELGALIARNHEEIDTLRQLGERDYVEFSIEGRGKPQKVGNVTVELRGTNPKRNLYTVAMVVGDTRVERKNRAINEPIFFYTRGTKQPLELVVNQVAKDKIVGYVSIPKVNESADMTAREASQTAEDARVIALKRQEQKRLAKERQAAVEREASARATSEAESQRRSQAEAEQRAEAERTAAQEEAEKARRAANGAERARLKAEQEKATLRAQIFQQLNTILETRETPRGLVVNIADALFDTDKYTLKPLTRERLAKVAGIISAHPGLRLEVESYTDNVGSEQFNQLLSERRAATVRDYVISQGIPMSSVVAKGFGKTQPVASNDTAAGRAHNRRVELIISGEVIGIAIAPSTAAPP